MRHVVALSSVLLILALLPAGFVVHAALGQRRLAPFPVVETGERVIAPPDGAHPFYSKYINADGIIVVSSDAVPDAARRFAG